MSTRPGGTARRSTRPLNAPETLIGRVLDGRFRLDRVLSTGGMGIVFEATQLSIRRTVAIKLLKPTLSADVELIQRFMQEVNVVATLQHPNIVATVDAGKDASGLAYLVMEFFDAFTFRDMLQRFELTLAEILGVFTQVCSALTEAHAAGIIHRDLKFENIMLKRMHDGCIHVKILDFGVAKLIHSDTQLTRGGQVPGTPGIIAPELVDGLAPTPQSDLYSLGVLLFTTLSGQAPYRGENDLALMHAHKTKPLPELSKMVPKDMPHALVAFVLKLMQKTPDKRPLNAQIVGETIEHLRYAMPASLSGNPYVPPSLMGDSAKNSDVRKRAFIVGHVEDESGVEARVRDQEAIEADFVSALNPNESPPILVPSSVTATLVLVLIALVLLCITMLYRLFFDA